MNTKEQKIPTVAMLALLALKISGANREELMTRIIASRSNASGSQIFQSINFIVNHGYAQTVGRPARYSLTEKGVKAITPPKKRVRAIPKALEYIVFDPKEFNKVSYRPGCFDFLKCPSIYNGREVYRKMETR